MYIGMVGPYSMGKTTAMDEILNFDLRAVKMGRVFAVSCDNCRERWREFGEIKEEKVSSWQGKVVEKHAEIYDVATAFDGLLFICETAWTDHMSGVASIGDALEFGDVTNYVLDFIVLTAKPDVFKKFIQERCEKRNKKFREDYWTTKRLTYEGMNRPLNAAKRYLTPYKIRWQHYEVDYKRTVWETILDRLFEDIETWQKTLK